MPKTYSEAGVDIDEEGRAIHELVSEIQKTASFRKGKIGESLTKIGHFSGIVRLDDTKALAISTDGVGSKVLIAEAMQKYDTIGIDLVAMNANDIICVGAEPIALVDYIAMERPDPEVTREIGLGLAKGAEMAGIAIVGGELASLPDTVRGLDLVGTIIGVVEIGKIISGETIELGDTIIGLESSGIHSNGLTLARKVLLEAYDIEEKVFGDRSVGEELLEPTKIYVKEVLDILNKVEVKGLANITGGGLGNLARLAQYGFSLYDLPKPHKVFDVIQEVGEISDEEMYRTFNMGIGFCVVVGEDGADKVIEICEKHGTKGQIIGRVAEGKGVRLEDMGFAFEYS
ncbi:MAG: phosphoribosylformylglycinamidine cyclo-ligase [Candidatus Hydrothermarchaeales archaeon]